MPPFTFVSREEWKALPPKETNPLNIPVKHVGWAETITDTCDTKEECCELVRFVQKCNMEKQGLTDIRHNFLISKDGTIYEGRGWLANTSKTDPSHDNLYGGFITVARIGMDIDEVPPNEIEMASWNKIMEYGIEAGYIQKDYAEANMLRHQY